MSSQPNTPRPNSRDARLKAGSEDERRAVIRLKNARSSKQHRDKKKEEEILLQSTYVKNEKRINQLEGMVTKLMVELDGSESKTTSKHGSQGAGHSSRRGGKSVQKKFCGDPF